MRHLSHLALALAVTFTAGSVAEAGRRAGHHGKSHKKAKAAAKKKTAQKEVRRGRHERDDEEEDDDDEEGEREDARAKKRSKRERRSQRDDADEISIDDDDDTEKTDDDSDDEDSDDDDDDRIAFAARGDDDDDLDPDAELVDTAPVRTRSKFRDWKIAVGPDLWMASVDANVSLGSASVSQGVDFMDITRHTSFGAAAVADARYGRFSLGGSLLYGVIDITGAKEVGPLMVSLDGTAKSLLVDGMAGYRVYGKDDSMLWVEGRAGIRYQRTAITAALDVSGNPVTPPPQVDAGSDALAGARVTARPPWMDGRFSFSAAFDTRVFGSSNSTWSAQAEASARLGDYVVLSLGYKTLLQDRAPVSTTMHGPRIAVQLAF